MSAGIRRRSPEEIVTLIIVRADVISVVLDDPWVWAYLGPQKLRRAQDALDELRLAVTTPSDDELDSIEAENERLKRQIEDVREAVNDLHTAGSDPAVLRVIESALARIPESKES